MTAAALAKRALAGTRPDRDRRKPVHRHAEFRGEARSGSHQQDGIDAAASEPHRSRS